MSNKYHGSIRCPLCGKYVTLRPNGKMYRHGPQNSCPGAADYVVERSDSPRAREVIGTLRRLWHIGDAFAASRLTGIPYPAPAIPEGMSVDGELAFIVADARAFITDAALRIGASAAVNKVAA